MSMGETCPTCGETLPQHKQYCPSYIQQQMSSTKMPFNFNNNGHSLVADKVEPEIEEPYKVLKVKCPKCKAMPGFPCTFKRIKNDVAVNEVDFYAVHIPRCYAYEAFALGTVNEMGLSKNQIITGKGKE